jgi:hypothetical protein
MMQIVPTEDVNADRKLKKKIINGASHATLASDVGSSSLELLVIEFGLAFIITSIWGKCYKALKFYVTLFSLQLGTSKMDCLSLASLFILVYYLRVSVSLL